MADKPDGLTNIPSMSGRAIGDFLRESASAVEAPHVIVEVGAWLGAGTAQLAEGVRGRANAPKIHSYDLFRASQSEVGRAKQQGTDLEVGADTRPLVRSWLDPLQVDVTLHKGDILDACWNGPEIGLYVDDAAKTPTLFYHVLDTFAPFWIPGETVVVLMDYGFWKNCKTRRGQRRMRIQQNFVEQHPECFEPLRHDAIAASCEAAFRYLAPLPFAAIRRQATLRRFLSKLPG